MKNSRFNYIKKENKIKGYKIFLKKNGRLVCRDFVFDENKTNRINKNTPIKLCWSGFHFCTDLMQCLRYYNLVGDYVACEVTGYGHYDVEYDGSKYAVRCLDIIRVIPEKEVYEIFGINTARFGKVEEKIVTVDASNNNRKIFKPFDQKVKKYYHDTGMNSRGISVKNVAFGETFLADVEIMKPKLYIEGIKRFNEGYHKILKLKYKLQSI